MSRRIVVRWSASTALVVMLAMPATALADVGHVHPASPVPPTVVETTEVTGGGDIANPNAPAPGAQPAAPAEGMPPAAEAAATPAPTAVDATAARADAAAPAAHAGHAAATTQPAAVAPVEVDAPTPVPTASGGGTSDPTMAPPSATAGSGNLPFTGPEDNILLISLAGMLVPIGVLLYCGARRGDRRLHLAAPRFQWRE